MTGTSDQKCLVQYDWRQIPFMRPNPGESLKSWSRLLSSSQSKIVIAPHKLRLWRETRCMYKMLSCLLSGLTMVYGRYNSIVIPNGVYKPTYNWGAPSCTDWLTSFAVGCPSTETESRGWNGWLTLSSSERCPCFKGFVRYCIAGPVHQSNCWIMTNID